MKLLSALLLALSAVLPIASSCAQSEGIDDGPPGKGFEGGITDGAAFGGSAGSGGGSSGTGGGGSGGTGGSCTPSGVEVCDGVDNDCDGQVDEQPPSGELCDNLPGATAECDGANGCKVKSCLTDFYDIDGQAENGCECEASPAPATTGESCAQPIDVGTLADVTADSTTRKGNIPFAGREVWYTFQATDDADTNGDEFHVDVRFVTNPGDLRMEVYRNGCPGTGTQLATGEADKTDWFVDFNKNAAGVTCATGTGCGEGNCRAASNPSNNWNHCTSDTATFFVKIYSEGAPACTEFEIELSNGKY